jgi:hypothetical protein
LAVEGLTPFFDRILRRISRENGLIIAEYIAAMKREINISPGYKKANIQTLVGLIEFHSNKKKNFNEMTREDILQYLDGLRRPEASDPLHKWIGTYNLCLIIVLRFLSAYYPDIEPDKRPKPKVVENIARLK